MYIVDYGILNAAAQAQGTILTCESQRTTCANVRIHKSPIYEETELHILELA